MRVYGKEEGSVSQSGITYQQERWNKYPLTYLDFVNNGGTWESTITLSAGLVCSGVKVVPTVQWTSAGAMNLTVDHNTDSLLTSYNVISATPGTSEFKTSLVYLPISSGSVVVKLDAQPTAGELDLWLMLSHPEF